MAFNFTWLQMWPDLIQKAKEGGLDVVQTYVFWNGHEPSPGKVTELVNYFSFHFWVGYKRKKGLILIKFALFCFSTTLRETMIS